MNQLIKDIMKRNNYVMYEYSDDERTNTNEKYIIYDSTNNKYLIRYEKTEKIVDTLSEARKIRDKILAKEGVIIIDR